MQTNENGANSVITQGNSFYTSLSSFNPSDSINRQTQNHVISGYAVPTNNFNGTEMENRVTIAYPDEFCSMYPQVSNFQETGRFMEPDQEKLVASEYPFVHPVIDNSSYEALNYGYNMPFVQTNEWPGSSRFTNELSLSLATAQPGNSDLSSSGLTSFSSSFNSYKQIQVPESRFIHAMQEILAEIARYALGNSERMNFDFSDGADGGGGAHTFMSQNNALEEREVVARKKHLLSLLQVVDDRYNQCMDEIHTVTSAFHAVTELDPNLHARFVLPTISFMFKNLRERISSNILALGANNNHNEGETREDKSFETRFIQRQWALQQLSKRDPLLWRPQRGLPENSVSVLRAWMFQNFLHPYPKDAEKHLLALKSGLTRNQVSNWFINARVRLWKPMIEEMYSEMNRRKARRSEDETEGNNRKNLVCFENRRFTME
ncbi:hypothetical protein CASFOL_022284 [Castilleja foliolosa]|uniref:Homeobox domain-containing protein n=1 Tax=Castilleja foliolosa TaxID=1961234 RepID=A0ABD3CV62_9LAMI